MKIGLGCDPCPYPHRRYRTERVHVLLGNRAANGQQVSMTDSHCCIDSVTCPALTIENGRGLPSLTVRPEASANRAEVQCDNGYTTTEPEVVCSELGWAPLPRCCDTNATTCPSARAPVPAIEAFSRSSADCRQIFLAASTQNSRFSLRYIPIPFIVLILCLILMLHKNIQRRRRMSSQARAAGSMARPWWMHESPAQAAPVGARAPVAVVTGVPVTNAVIASGTEMTQGMPVATAMAVPMDTPRGRCS